MSLYRIRRNSNFKPRKQKLKKTRLLLRKIRASDLRTYLVKELNDSTTHGLPYLVNTNIHVCERLFWGGSFVFCLYLVYVLLSPLYVRYKGSPTVTSVEMDYFNWNISFPAITLCANIKPDNEVFPQLVREYKNNTGRDLSTYLWYIKNVNLYSLDKLELLPPPEIIALIPSEEYATIAARTFVKFESQSVSTNTNSPITIRAAMTDRGMCHVINSNVAIFDNPLKWRDPPAEYEKRNIELSVHDSEFFTQIMDYADNYQIFIHSPDENIYSTTVSYQHAKDNYLTLGVMVSSTRISDELRKSNIGFRKCRMVNEPISERYPVYSYNHCMTECRIKMVKKLCGCVPHFYKPYGNEKVCSLTNLTCVMLYWNEITSLSVPKEITARFANSKDLPSSSRECGCPNNCEGNVYFKDQEELMTESTVTRVRIGISNFPKIRIVREVLFGFYDILLRSGGVINLCIGTSVISLMELIMIFLRMAIRTLTTHIKHILTLGKQNKMKMGVKK